MLTSVVLDEKWKRGYEKNADKKSKEGKNQRKGYK